MDNFQKREAWKGKLVGQAATRALRCGRLLTSGDWAGERQLLTFTIS